MFEYKCVNFISSMKLIEKRIIFLLNTLIKIRCFAQDIYIYMIKIDNNLEHSIKELYVWLIYIYNMRSGIS